MGYLSDVLYRFFSPSKLFYLNYYQMWKLCVCGTVSVLRLRACLVVGVSCTSSQLEVRTLRWSYLSRLWPSARIRSKSNISSQVCQELPATQVSWTETLVLSLSIVNMLVVDGQSCEVHAVGNANASLTRGCARCFITEALTGRRWKLTRWPFYKVTLEGRCYLGQ